MKQYTYLLQDVSIYMEEVMNIFELEFDFVRLAQENGSVEDGLFLKNHFCLLYFDIWQSFPYQDVSISFFLLNSEQKEIKVDKKLVKSFIDFDHEGFSGFCASFKPETKLRSQVDNEYSGYTLAVISNNEILKRFYYKLLDGSHTYAMYVEYQNLLREKYDISSLHYANIPTYKEVFKNKY